MFIIPQLNVIKQHGINYLNEHLWKYAYYTKAYSIFDVRLNTITYLNIVIAISNGRLVMKSNDLGSEYSNPFTAIKFNRE